MRFTWLFPIAAAIAGKTICASPDDCYPQIFVPTNEWQQIRPGQDIPPGLHVRLNVDTLVREAKLMDDEEDDVNAVYVGDEALAVYTPEVHEHVDSWDAAVDEILGYGTRLQPAFDIIADLAHDLEFGEKLAKNTQVFPRFVEIAQANPEYQDQIYRIMALLLRNNPQAVKLVIESPQSKETVLSLLDQLNGSDDTIQKRILGVVLPLTTPEELMNHYPYLGAQARERLNNVLEDDGVKKRDGSSASPDEQLSTYLQKRVPLAPKNQFFDYFDALVDLHKGNAELDANDEFLNWLASEGEKQKGANAEVYRRLIDARHNVFGNPMAMRKALADEL